MLCRRDGALKLVTDLGPDGPVDRGMRTVRLARHHRGTGIGSGPDRHVQRDLAQEWDAQPFRCLPRTAMTENVRARAAFGALKVAHILADAEHRHGELLEHATPPPRAAPRAVR